MKPDLLLAQLRDTQAMVSALLDADVTITSIHIGPTRLPPTIRIRPGEYTRQHESRASLNHYSGEMFIARCGVEIAWEAVPRSPSDTIASAVARLEADIEKSTAAPIFTTQPGAIA